MGSDQLRSSSKTFWSFLSLIWFVCVWVIWKERNSLIFKILWALRIIQDESLHHLVDRVKLLSFWWLKINNITFSFDYHMWWLNPLICPGLVISAQKWYISCVSLGILVTCFARLSMEKLQFYANMSFMLYVPYSTLFVQENISKDQEINQNARSARFQLT